MWVSRHSKVLHSCQSLLLSIIHTVLNDYLAIIDKDCKEFSFFIGAVSIISSCIILAIAALIIMIAYHCFMKMTAMNRPHDQVVHPAGKVY